MLRAKDDLLLVVRNTVGTVEDLLLVDFTFCNHGLKITAIAPSGQLRIIALQTWGEALRFSPVGI